MWTRLTAVVVLAAAITSLDQTGRTARPAHVVDLTHTLDEDFPYVPVPGMTFPFKSTPIATIEKHGVAANRWDMHEHLGTHIDAPNHFAREGVGVDRLAVDTLVVPLAVIDISARARLDPDAVVTIADLASWEKRHGRLPRAAAVFMHSGWESRVRDPKAFINADAADTMHFPGFSMEAAEFLARHRQVSGLGVDTLSIDPGNDKAFRTHKSWLQTGRWAVEVAANLDDVPPTGATVFVGATKVRDATGGPVRLLATW